MSHLKNDWVKVKGVWRVKPIVKRDYEKQPLPKRKPAPSRRITLAEKQLQQAHKEFMAIIGHYCAELITAEEFQCQVAFVQMPASLINLIDPNTGLKYNEEN